MHRILTLLALVALASLFVVGCSDNNSKSPSTPDTTEDLVPPAAPTSLNVYVKDSKVTLAWMENGELDLASYKVYRSLNGSDYEMTASLDHARYEETLTGQGLYHVTYRVTALDDSGNESSFSQSVEASIDLNDFNFAKISASDTP